MFAFSSFTQKYPWAFGIIMIAGGPIIALFGQRFFPWVIAGIVSIVSKPKLLFYFSSLFYQLNK